MNIPTTLLAEGMSFGDRASKAGIVALQGILTIFLVLSILWAAIEIMHLLLHRKSNSSPKPSPTRGEASASPAPQDDLAVAAAIAAAMAASEDEGATVAAITAAIIAARAEEGDTTPFRVVSFRRRTAKRS